MGAKGLSPTLSSSLDVFASRAHQVRVAFQVQTSGVDFVACRFMRVIVAEEGAICSGAEEGAICSGAEFLR